MCGVHFALATGLTIRARAHACCAHARAHVRGARPCTRTHARKHARAVREHARACPPPANSCIGIVCQCAGACTRMSGKHVRACANIRSFFCAPICVLFRKSRVNCFVIECVRLQNDECSTPCMRACVSVWLLACVRACVHACVRGRARAFLWVSM